LDGYAISAAVVLIGNYLIYIKLRCCPPSKCCRRDYEKKPIQKWEFNVPAGITILMAIMIISVGIAG
jgi:hypothetical protein